MSNPLAAEESMDRGFDSNCLSAASDWFAVFTAPRHEKRVAEHFRVREIENFLPLLQTPRRWKDGSVRTLQLPLFSGYIFVRIGCGKRTSVLAVPGVIRIVGARREPFPISDAYICSLREGLRQRKIEPHPYLTVGMRVRIRTGVMAGMEGVLQRKKSNFRVVLTLEMIMQSISVEIAIHDIEPIGETAASDLYEVARAA